MIKNLIIFLFIACSIYSTDDKYKLNQWVTDYTNTLTPEQILFLNKKLKDYQDSTTTQIVVLIIKSLEGNSIEDLANEIFTYNKIGTKQNDNGVLILVSLDDKAIRIEVGYGLESKLTDALSSSIIRNDIIPYFKAENYFEGINSGLNSIIKAIDGEYKSDKKKSEDKIDIFSLIISVIIIFILISTLIRSNRYYRIGSTGFGYRNPWGGGFGGFGGFGGGGFGGGFSGGGGMSGGGGASGRW
ncbi:MAG: TPM domain-containing protein [Ignavibacterium sp.]|nr:TPM domain-containing protein [Ignavibacterium sp.]